MLSRTAHADTNASPPSAPAPARLAVPLVPPSSKTEPEVGESRWVAGIVLGSGVAAIAAGTAIALAYQRDVAGSREDNLAGLGVACGGVAVAMVGAMLWLNLPQTSTQVSVARSGLVLSGHF